MIEWQDQQRRRRVGSTSFGVLQYVAPGPIVLNYTSLNMTLARICKSPSQTGEDMPMSGATMLKLAKMFPLKRPGYGRW